MSELLITVFFTLIWWGMFAYSFGKDRSRYRNCYLLFFAIISLFPLIIEVSGSHAVTVMFIILLAVTVALLITPFFLIHNGIVMIKREGKCKAHLLSLALGIAVLVGEVLTIFNVVAYSMIYGLEATEKYTHTTAFLITSLIITTVIYGSMAFVIFMIYSLFLMIIPRRKQFDYVIIHGAGLIDGDQVSPLLRQRLDKAIRVYRKDKTPTKMIPSGGQGADESRSEAEAMKEYLLSKDIPESDIVIEDKSTTTLENLKFSKKIIDGFEGKKTTALVTSNYHVYRALRYCRKTGLKCTGIGSHVAWYYWPCALIREFIAVHAEKKHAILFTSGWLICMALMVMMVKS